MLCGIDKKYWSHRFKFSIFIKNSHEKCKPNWFSRIDFFLGIRKKQAADVISIDLPFIE